jgi:hypothetical protein
MFFWVLPLKKRIEVKMGRSFKTQFLKVLQSSFPERIVAPITHQLLWVSGVFVVQHGCWNSVIVRSRPLELCTRLDCFELSLVPRFVPSRNCERRKTLTVKFYGAILGVKGQMNHGCNGKNPISTSWYFAIAEAFQQTSKVQKRTRPCFQTKVNPGSTELWVATQVEPQKINI